MITAPLPGSCLCTFTSVLRRISTANLCENLLHRCPRLPTTGVQEGFLAPALGFLVLRLQRTEHCQAYLHYDATSPSSGASVPELKLSTHARTSNNFVTQVMCCNTLHAKPEVWRSLERILALSEDCQIGVGGLARQRGPNDFLSRCVNVNQQGARFAFGAHSEYQSHQALYTSYPLCPTPSFLQVPSS